jgi:hypothetical protein
MGMPTMQNQQPQNQGKGVSPGNYGNPYMAQNSWRPIATPAQAQPPQPTLSIPSSFGSGSAQDKAAFYNQSLGQGFTDQDIRSAVNNSMGQQSDTDWGALQGIAQQNKPSQPQSNFNTIEGDDFGTQRPDPYRNQPFSQRMNSGKGMGSNVTTPGQGGQPRIGQPNNYTKTTGGWDNARIWPQQSSQSSGGKGKGY